MEYRLELVLLPVADVDRAKTFYTERCGFHLDVDRSPTPEFRVVQLTPPGSACSITVGKGLLETAPDSVRGLHLCVEVSPIRHFADGAWQPGHDPQRRTYHSFADFANPDGN